MTRANDAASTVFGRVYHAAISGPRASKRWMYAVGVLFAVVGVLETIQTVATFFGHDTLRWYAQDFPAFYTAAHLIATGSGDLIYDTTAMAAAELKIAGTPVGGSGVLAYFNPPFFALALAPLTMFSMDRAFQVWTLFGVCLLVVECALLWQVAQRLSLSWRVGLIAGFATLFPVAYGLQHGQFSLIVVVSWTVGFLLLYQRRDLLAGIALAPLLIKPELALPIAAYLALRRRWGALAALAVMTLLAAGVSVAAIGISASIDYPAVPAGEHIVGGSRR